MPETLTADSADTRVLPLFDQAMSVDTPTPGARAWLARDPATQLPILIKRLRADSNKARATTALHLSHPNIVRTRRWMTEGGHLYIVRDVVRGRNLTQALAALSFRQTPELLEKLLLPALSALEAAHGRGVPHGGISPENILVAEDGKVLLSDFAACDSSASPHVAVYQGVATVQGDVRAFGNLIIRFLPTTGLFAADAVRQRIKGIIDRCDSLSDLRETLTALDKFAAAPLPKAGEIAKPPLIEVPPVLVGPPPLVIVEEEEPITVPETPTLTIDESPTNPAEWVKRTPTAGPIDPPVKPGVARLAVRSTAPDGVRIVRGGGGPATLLLTNEGDATLTVRMIATQHAWLNVRPMELPITLPAGASAPVDFSVSAARLSVGSYRSEVYLSASAGGKNAEDLRGGWFKHTAEVRVIVVEGNEASASASLEKPPYPANAPKIPAPPGCMLFFVLGLTGITSGLFLGIRLLLS